MRLIMIGAPGSGKGTQAVRIAEELAVPHVSTGDLLRARRGDGTELGESLAQYLDSGTLVPDEVVSQLAFDRIDADDAAAGFILDGFPRTTAQAEALNAHLAGKGSKIDAVLHLDVSDEEVQSRMMARGRADDNPEVIADRLRIFHSESEPILEVYGDAVVTVPGTGDVDEITKAALTALR